MKIFITGVNGFIGQHLAYALLQRGHKVIGLGRSPSCGIIGITKYYSGSVLDRSIVKKVLSRVDATVHLAALTEHKDIIDNPFKTLDLNLEGTKNVLDAFTASKTAKKLIYSSTGKVYGSIEQLPITEEHSAKPLNILGKSKHIAEQLIDFYSNNRQSFIVLRIFNTYGPKQKSNFLVPTIIAQLENKELILGDIEARRDYVYISDVIEAFVLAIETNNKPGLSIYNICSGVGTSALEIVKLIGDLKKTNYKIKIKKTLYRRDEMQEEYGSYAKAKEKFGWNPKVTLKKGLQQILGL